MKKGDKIYSFDSYMNYETSEFSVRIETFEILHIDKIKDTLFLSVRDVDTNTTWKLFYNCKDEKLEPYHYFKRADAVKKAKELLKKEINKHYTNLNILREEYENLR